MGRAPRRAVAVVLAGLAVLARGLHGRARRSGRRSPSAGRACRRPRRRRAAPPPPEVLPEPSPRHPDHPVLRLHRRRRWPRCPRRCRPGGRCRWTAGRSPCRPTTSSPAAAGCSLNVLSVGAPGAPRGPAGAGGARRHRGRVLRAGRGTAGRAGRTRRCCSATCWSAWTAAAPGRTCWTARPLDARSAIIDADLDSAGDAELTWLLEEARSVVQECTITLDGGLGNFRTTRVDRRHRDAAAGARGGPAVRDRGRRRGGRAGRLGPDCSRSPWAGWCSTGRRTRRSTSPALSESRAGAAEAAFNAFAVACTAQPDCPLGADPRLTVTGTLTRLHLRPQAALDGRRLTAGARSPRCSPGSGEPAGWPALAGALAAVDRGDPGPMLDLLEPVAGSGGRFDTMLATTCNDTRRRLAPGRDRRPVRTAGAPRTRSSAAPWRCTCWPARRGRPAARRRRADRPRARRRSWSSAAAGDPRNPADGARSTADSLASGRFLNWQGAGTGAYPRTACVRNVVDADLLDGVIPQPEVLCRRSGAGGDHGSRRRPPHVQ